MARPMMFDVAVFNLREVLLDLKQCQDAQLEQRAAMGLGLLAEIEKMTEKVNWSPDAAPPVIQSEVCSHDETNYDTYRLLHRMGLTDSELIAVAYCEKLHEVRVLRMLRLVFGLSLEEAQSILAANPPGQGK